MSVTELDADTINAGAINSTRAINAFAGIDVKSPTTGQLVAQLRQSSGAGGSLTFFDADFNRLVQVGLSDDGTAAGISAFDDNTLASGTGVARDFFGVAGSADPNPGFGMAVLGADGSSRRIEIGSSLDGTTDPSAVYLYDSAGTMRTGVEVAPSLNFVGFFTGIYKESGGFGGPLSFAGTLESLAGNAYDNSASFAWLYDSSGNLRNGIQYNPSVSFNGFFSQDGSGHNLSLIGNASNNSASYSFLYDSSGNLRNGIQYNPSVNFNGFFSQDAVGHGLSSVGNFLTTNVGLSQQANESFMDLSDTSGTLRLFEFQNSTNQGGINFNPGSTVVQGFWGNP